MGVRAFSRLSRVALIVFLLMLASACANRYQNVGLGLTVGGMAPVNEIEQVYYLGVFDPRGQVAPQMYRIRVHGQSSLGGGKFASGWVPASVIDTLNLPAYGNETADASGMGLGDGTGETFLGGRNLVAFGPEGFREVPQNHRLVMVMGNDANQFFTAVSQSLGAISNATIQIASKDLSSEVFAAMNDLLREQLRMSAHKRQVGAP